MTVLEGNGLTSAHQDLYGTPWGEIPIDPDSLDVTDKPTIGIPAGIPQVRPRMERIYDIYVCPTCGSHPHEDDPYCAEHRVPKVRMAVVAVGSARDPNGAWHPRGPLAQIEQMAEWADLIGEDNARNYDWETAKKIATNLRAAIATLMVAPSTYYHCKAEDLTVLPPARKEQP